MQSISTKMLVFLMTTTLILIPFGSSALAQEYFETKEAGGGAMIFDFAVVRPVGIAAAIVGSAFYLVSLPFAMLGNNADASYQKLVAAPAKYTFNRPLGEF